MGFSFCPNQEALDFSIVREMFRGDTFIFNVQIKDPETSAPINLTGWTVWFTAKRTYVEQDNLAIVQLSTLTSGITFVDAVNGKIKITVPPIATISFPDGDVSVIYDIQVKDTAGNIFTVELGELIVHPDITRST